MSKPVLLVDVDGVVNVFGFIAVELEEEFEADGYTIRVPKGTRERIARLEELYNCTWATTWEYRATTLLAPRLKFGSEWPVMRFEAGGYGDRLAKTWKLPTVQGWYKKVLRPFAWIDDDLWEDVDFFEHKLEGQFLPVRTTHSRGLNDEHVKELEQFARRIARE